MSYTIPLNDQVERDSTVYQFEQTIANFYGAPYAIAVDSCTHAIELCMRYLIVLLFLLILTYQYL